MSSPSKQCPQHQTDPKLTKAATSSCKQAILMESTYGKPFTVPSSSCHTSLRRWSGSSAVQWANSQEWFSDSRSRAPKGTTVQLSEVPRSELGSESWCWCQNTCLSFLPLWRGQWHMLPIQVGMGTQFWGISLPLLDDIWGAEKQFSDSKWLREGGH